MAAEDVFFDPGLGFAKNAQQSYTLLARLAEFQSEGLMVGGGEPQIVHCLTRWRAA